MLHNNRLLDEDVKKCKLEARKRKNAESMLSKRQAETPEKRQKRLQEISVRQAACRQAETPESRKERL